MPKVKVAFVSTNSITQGEQIGVLWSYLFSCGIKIHFAHRTFKWNNEARSNAAVHCIILGFAAFDIPKKRLFDYQTATGEPHEVETKNINPYLIDAADIVINDRSTPIGDVPSIVNGNKPTDGGHLLLTDEDKAEILSKEPQAEKFIKPFVSAHEFINGETRWCLWLKDVSPTEWRTLPEVVKRVQAVREFRGKSKKPDTVRIAETPYLFGQVRQPESNYVLIPRHSSENRRYVPMAFFPPTYIIADSCTAVPNATLYHFGVLTSQMHNAWMRQVCGRIKSDYRYSNGLVYNNFPFPKNVDDKQREKVEQAAQTVLDTRAQFSEATLADLYDPNAMPQELLKAHRDLDSAVDTCYGRKFKTDLERLEFLFDLYRQYTDPLTQLAEQETKRAKRTRRTKSA